jgi:acyl-coenzyme A thioesterase PaaI-like protein
MAQPKKYTPAIEASLAHFRNIAWINGTHLSDPTFQILDLSRTLTQPGNGHSLSAETWNTEKTITHLLTTYRPPDSESGRAGEVRRFYTFGTGLNAHPGLLHGGVIATILDSTMGNIILHQIRPKAPTFTVVLNITYKKPISTPGSVLVRSSVIKVDGRKMWVRGVVEGSSGEIHATAEGMWLMAKEKL